MTTLQRHSPSGWGLRPAPHVPLSTICHQHDTPVVHPVSPASGLLEQRPPLALLPLLILPVQQPDVHRRDQRPGHTAALQVQKVERGRRLLCGQDLKGDPLLAEEGDHVLTDGRAAVTWTGRYGPSVW